VCDLETSRMGAPYICDISRLKVNDLTLILLTWKKWWAPNNASKQHMGFNLGFKWLTGPNIFLNICLSKMRSLFSSFAVKVQVSCSYIHDHYFTGHFEPKGIVRMN